jgi:uncharacterized protein YycO
MRVLLYRGMSFISKVIQFQTRSQYSHAALQFSDGTVIEAWHVGGVRKLISPWEGHDKNTQIDVFDINGAVDERAVADFSQQQLGKRYDFVSILRFLDRRNMPKNNAWFCSELVVEQVRIGGIDLLSRIPASHVSPRDLSISPILINCRRLR